MDRKICIALIVFVFFLIWLYLAIYESSIEHWWSVNEVEQTTEDSVQIGVSFIKVLGGTVIFIVSAFIFYLFTGRRS
ncbi:hypothetical protein [Planococcus halotolerans]|uniref:Uncharacterized protein n=1 Tax=Planococcus halotolerans TaxID=2233542 RepID=A0A365L8C0_9BACL|nr:hypothetical protein [Planococcus halotolerans]QHJ69799.1 hypothetical protein DNR44_003925 [Planococcus halotolerans]RAZ81507.1 hypothetical protein DP120_04330 [Planococcus halotolerans]